jgi:hypothetical protein
VSPADYGLERLRHFGFFKPPCRTALWPEMLAWLDAQAAREGRKLEPKGR